MELKELREDRGWTQAQLVSQLEILDQKYHNYEESWVSKLERAYIWPDRELVIALATVFEMQGTDRIAFIMLARYAPGDEEQKQILMEYGQRLQDQLDSEIPQVLASQESPRLGIGQPSIELFTDGLVTANYATIEVANESNVEARDCWAWADVDERDLTVPLHWAGTEITAAESHAPRIAINSAKPARLDIAVALPPPGQTPSGLTKISGDVVMFVQQPREPKLNTQGCWLAQPVALYKPNPGLESYLPPGEYHIAIRVGCEGGMGDTGNFIITSPHVWKDLAIRPQ